MHTHKFGNLASKLPANQNTVRDQLFASHARNSFRPRRHTQTEHLLWVLVMTTPARIIPSYPHSAGCTTLAYSQDGRFLITAGADQLIRKFTVNEDSNEPETFEQHAEPVTAVAASRNTFASASEDCTVNLFNLAKSHENVKLLTRCTLPVRNVAFSPDGEWLGVASE